MVVVLSILWYRVCWKKNGNNFHISPPISAYYTSNYVYLKKNRQRYWVLHSVKSKNVWKIQNQSYVANFSDKNLWKHFDFMNKCNMNEYESSEKLNIN